MLLEQEQDSLFIDHKQRAELREEVLKAAFRFPRLFSRPLYRSFEQMVVNSPSDFLGNRSIEHLKKILSVQFFLQKKIEASLEKDKKTERQFFLRLFRGPGRICAAFAFSSSYSLRKKQFLEAIDGLLPGIFEVPRSFYLFHSNELPYYFCYFEIDKVRGTELSVKQLHGIEKSLLDQILTLSPMTPAVFWPYNKEESHRQIQILIREMKSKEDLPHISIHFQEQTSSSLEFLVHFVRPKAAERIPLEKLPDSLYFFRLTHHIINKPFLIEAEAFSVKMDAQLFDLRDTINLLYARRYLVRQLAAIIGPLRDYNGGLFEKQQDLFEEFRIKHASKVPYFDLFAERVFYALHPFERWFHLSPPEVEDLFLSFSELIQNKCSFCYKETQSGLFTIVKATNRAELQQLKQKNPDFKASTASGQLTIGDFHYECFSGQSIEKIDQYLQNSAPEKNTLFLAFQEGFPPTLNPHYSAGDMRCRVLNKLLFEGLTRLGENQTPELAGALRCEISHSGLIYTFTLRKNHWSNGEKVTAHDYVDTWKWALQESISHPELLFSIKNAKQYREGNCGLEIVGIRAINAETLEVELEKPDSQFLYKLAQPFFFPIFGDYREPKWFNGPYLLHEINKTGIKLTRNPYFWNVSEISYEQIEIQLIDDIDAIYQQFRQGSVDWIGDPLSILSVKQIRELDQEQRLHKEFLARRFFLHFNTKNPVLSSVPIRKALSLSIDREAICKDIFPYSTPFRPIVESKELAVFYFEQGLLELGLTRKTFPRLTFSYSDQTRRDQLALYLQTTWAETLGIQIELKKQNWNSFRSQLEKRNYEICVTIHDTIDEGSIRFLERFEGNTSWNFSQWVHPPYRALLTAAQNDSDKQYELRNMLAEHVPSVPLFNYVHLYAMNPEFNCSFFDHEGCVDFSKGSND